MFHYFGKGSNKLPVTAFPSGCCFVFCSEMKRYISNLATKVDGVILICSPYYRILEYIISLTSQTQPTPIRITFRILKAICTDASFSKTDLASTYHVTASFQVAYIHSFQVGDCGHCYISNLLIHFDDGNL